jgi:hypothetical protein
MHFDDGHSHVDADGECGCAGEQAGDNEQSAEKFGERGKVAGPCGKAQAGYELGMMMESAEDFVRAVDEHDDSQGETHEQ